jgi:hypothetical protein
MTPKRPHDLLVLLSRRRVAFLLLGIVTLFCALSQHAFSIALPVSYSPSLVVGAIALAVWIGATWHRRDAAERALAVVSTGRRAARSAFRDTVSAFLVPTRPDDEPEAEALREGLLRRHTALLAAVDAMADGVPPESAPDVIAHTSPHERADRSGSTLVERLTALQREALAASQRLGFMGELRTSQLDQQLQTLSRPMPHRHPETHTLLTLATTSYALMLPLVSAHRIATTLVAAACAVLLIAFEATATSPRRAELD